jgi:hypothetical protein
MSWDVAIVKIRGEFRPLEEVEADDYLPLGKLSTVQEAIKKAFPTAEWYGPTEAVYSADEFAIEFGLQEADPLETVILNVRHGNGDPIPALLSLAEPNGWLLLDVSTSEFIDPKDPSRAGWEGYQSLVTGKKTAKAADAKKKQPLKKPAKRSSKKKKVSPKKSTGKDTIVWPTTYDRRPEGFTGTRRECVLIPPTRSGKWTERYVTARYKKGRLIRFDSTLFPVPPKGKCFTGEVAFSQDEGPRGEVYIVTTTIKDGEFLGETKRRIRQAEMDFGCSIVISKIRGEFRQFGKLSADDYVPLGRLSAMQVAIRKAFPSAEWPEPTKAFYAEDDFSIEISMWKGSKTVKWISVDVHHGKDGAVPALLSLTEPNGWLMRDDSQDKFIVPKKVSRAGAKGHKAVAGKKPTKSSKAKKKQEPKRPRQV